MANQTPQFPADFIYLPAPKDMVRPASDYYGDIKANVTSVADSQLELFIRACVKGPYEDNFVEAVHQFKVSHLALKQAASKPDNDVEIASFKAQYFNHLVAATLAASRHRIHFKTEHGKYTSANPDIIAENAQQHAELRESVIERLQKVASISDRILKTCAEVLVAVKAHLAESKHSNHTVAPKDPQAAESKDGRIDGKGEAK